MIAIPLTAVIILHATAFQTGLLTAAAWLPYVVLGIHAGAWADRWGRRRRVMIAADLGRAVMVLDIPAGAIRAAHVPEQLLARVSGAYTVVNYGVRPVGALLGGAMGTLLGPREALIIAAAVAVLGVVFLLPSPLPRIRELPEPGY